MKLKVDKEHILIPKDYDGKPGCGFDIAIIKVPEKDQLLLLNYMDEHEND